MRERIWLTEVVTKVFPSRFVNKNQVGKTPQNVVLALATRRLTIYSAVSSVVASQKRGIF
jgi:hypothetical protein